VQKFLASGGERYCLIGALALQRWGEPRVTRDVDVTLLCPFGSEAAAAERLLGAFKPRIDDARTLALRRRVVLLWSAGGIGIDVAFGGLPFEERCVGRASDWELARGVVLHTCSAEDLLILKTFAGRPRDWADIESVLVRQRKELDWRLIERELKPLLKAKESPESLEKLRRLRHKIEKGA
jgi:hypothetical protein